MNTLSSLLYYILGRVKEGKINLDTSAASGDDYDLTQALTNLGWLSDVVTSGVLGGKKLLYKILQTLMDIPILEMHTFMGTFTIASSGYVQIGSYLSGKTILAVTIGNWTSATGAFGVSYSGGAVYLIGTPNVTIKNPEIRFLYR